MNEITKGILIILGGGAFFWWHSYEKKKNKKLFGSGNYTMAVIKNIEEEEDKENDFTNILATYEYFVEDERYEHHASISYTKDENDKVKYSEKVGDSVNIFYDPKNPNEAKIDSIGNRITPYVLLLISVIMFIWGLTEVKNSF